jgi:hypothetical protein
VFVRNSPDGLSFPTPAATLDTVGTGHQWTPDISSASGVLHVVFYDSRGDPVYAPDVPPGNTADGTNSGDVVNTFLARSSDGGATWTETQLTSHGSNFNWETHGARRDGFWGDYIYVSAVPGAVQAAWTDSRDLLPGADPRETGSSGRCGRVRRVPAVHVRAQRHQRRQLHVAVDLRPVPVARRSGREHLRDAAIDAA